MSESTATIELSVEEEEAGDEKAPETEAPEGETEAGEIEISTVQDETDPGSTVVIQGEEEYTEVKEESVLEADGELVQENENEVMKDTVEEEKAEKQDEEVQHGEEMPVSLETTVDDNKPTLSSPVADIMKRLKQISVSIGPIKQQDLLSPELHKVLSLSTDFTIKFELKEVGVWEKTGKPKRSKLGYVKIPFEIRSPGYLVQMADRLGNLKIDGRDMSVKFPEEFNKSMQIVRKELEVMRKEQSEAKQKAKQQAAKLRRKKLHVHNIPEKADEETLKAMFPEACKVMLPDNAGTKGKPRFATLEFETEQAATDCLVTNKDVQIEDCKVRITRVPANSGNQNDNKKQNQSGGKFQASGRGSGRGGMAQRGDTHAKLQQLKNIRNQQRGRNANRGGGGANRGRGSGNRGLNPVKVSPNRGSMDRNRRNSNSKPGVLNNPMMMGMGMNPGMASNMGMMGMNMPYGMGMIGNPGMGNMPMGGIGNANMNPMNNMVNMSGGQNQGQDGQMSMGITRMQGSSAGVSQNQQQFKQQGNRQRNNSGSNNNQSRNSHRNRNRPRQRGRNLSADRSPPRRHDSRSKDADETKAMVAQLKDQLAKMEEKISKTHVLQQSSKSQYSQMDTYDSFGFSDSYRQGGRSDFKTENTSDMYSEYLGGGFDSGYRGGSTGGYSASKRKSDLDFSRMSPPKRHYGGSSSYQGGYSEVQPGSDNISSYDNADPYRNNDNYGNSSNFSSSRMSADFYGNMY